MGAINAQTKVYMNDLLLLSISQHRVYTVIRAKRDVKIIENNCLVTLITAINQAYHNNKAVLPQRNRTMPLFFPRWRPAAILDLVEPEIAPFHPPTVKTLP